MTKLDVCLACNTAMLAVEPDEITHPCCDPDDTPLPVLSIEEITELIGDQGWCGDCGEPILILGSPNAAGPSTSPHQKGTEQAMPNVQQRRTKGWRKPDGAFSVARQVGQPLRGRQDPRRTYQRRCGRAVPDVATRPRPLPPTVRPNRPRPRVLLPTGPALPRRCAAGASQPMTTATAKLNTALITMHGIPRRKTTLRRPRRPSVLDKRRPAGSGHRLCQVHRLSGAHPLP
jgi:hypothetical protein